MTNVKYQTVNKCLIPVQVAAAVVGLINIV